MLTALTITFREALEMLIILVPLMIYVTKIGKEELSKYIVIGSSAGLVVSIISGILIISGINSLRGLSKDIFLGGTMVFIALLVLYNIAWVGKIGKTVSLSVEDNNEVKLEKISLFLLAFVTVFRESLEIILFLIPLANLGPISIILGVSIGAVISVIVMYLIYKTSLKLRINLIFNVLTVFLILIGGHLFGEGIDIFVEGEDVEMAASLIYIIPLLIIFIKKQLKNLVKKN
ncbi:FTR1 family protein [Clostridium sp. DL1XJH146]